MAVEIPVVVDIEGGFEDAAKRIPSAMKPLKSAIESSPLTTKITIGEEFKEASEELKELNKYFKELEDADIEKVGEEFDFSIYINRSIMELRSLERQINEIQDLMQSEGGSGDFSFAEEYNRLRQSAAHVVETIRAMQSAQQSFNASLNDNSWKKHVDSLTESNKELDKMRAYYAELERSSYIMSDSINAIRDRIAALNAEWNNMTKAERESSRGDEIRKRHAEEIRTLKEEALTLDQLMQKEQRRAQLVQQGVQKRRYENAILNTTVQTMRVLQEQERILQERLSRAVIDSGAYNALKEKLEEVRQKLREVRGETDDATESFSRQNSVLQRLIPSFATYVSLHSLLRFAKQIRDVTGELEYQRVALGHLIQDTEYGATLFERIKAAAVESPFRIKDLVTYTKQLAAYRIETTKLFDTTKRLADVSAGLGVDMDRLILAYGQVRAASVLRGQELRQFTEAGIPLVELLADKFTELEGHLVSTADVFKRISERAVPFSMISEIFEDLTDAGGAFYQMQETQAKTLQGRWEKLKDTFDIALQTIGDTKTFRWENDLLLKTLNLLAKNLRVIPKLLSAATAGWIAYRIATMRARIEEQRSARAKIVLTAEDMARIKTLGLSTRATDLYTKALIRQRAATTALSKGFWKLTAAMLSNPVTAILVGVTALISAFFTFRKSVDKATESAQKLSEWTDTIERQGQIISEHKRMDTLISRYERLTAKTQLTAKEQQSLSQTMRVLQQRFRDVTLELNNSNNSVEAQVRRLRTLNDESKAAAVSTLQLTKAQIEQRLTILGQQEQQQTSTWLAATRVKGELESVNKLTGKQRRELKKATKTYEEYGDALNKTSEEINTLQNRLVSIDNVLNPQIDTTNLDNAADSMSELRDRISELTNAYKKFIELQEYEGRERALRDISILYPSLKSWIPSYENMLQKLTDMLNEYEGDADATRIIEEALANVRFDKLKSDIDDMLKKLTDDMKKSETARNFFNNILDLTGSEDIAANITATVYGGVGKDFKERMQEELYRALTELEPDHIDKDLLSQIMGDITVLDVEDIKKNLEQLPPKVRKVFEDAFAENEKYNAEWYQNFIKTYQKAKTYEERINELERKKRQQQQEAITMKMPEADVAAVGAYFDKEIAKVQLESIKDTYTWTKAFEDLDGVSDNTLRNLIGLINDYIKLYGQNLEPQQMKELVRQRENAEQQLISRNAYVAVADAVQRLSRARRRQSLMERNGLDQTEAYTKELDDERKAIKDLEAAFASIESQMSDAIGVTKDLLSTFATSDDAEYFSEQLDNLQKTMSSVGQAGVGVARLLANPLDPTAWVQAFKGLEGIVSSVFNMFKAAKFRQINLQINSQQSILRNLEKEYNRLEKAIASAFGSDYIYNYNEQLKNLEAQVVAYREQARLEAEKGKGADQDKIKGYEDAIEQAESQMEEMQGQLATFFAGTDVTSAAKDFASAWIEAYKSFGSTTSAMKEKFQDMIESMISQSLASKMMQTILDPLFKEIDDMAKSGGELSAEEIATIAQQTPEYIDRINDAMNSLMTQLLGAGYNVRQQSGNLTGIARSAAGASEESINGLAAGINTSLYYQSYLPTISMDVAAIRAAIAGSTPATTAATNQTTTTTFGDDVFRGQMLRIDENLAGIWSMLRSVINVKGTKTSTHYIATE